MTQSKKTAAHYRARMTGLAAAMLAAAMGIAGAQELYPSRVAHDRSAGTKLNPQKAPSRGTAPVSIALERAAAKAWAPVPCTPKARAT
jgi:hypothetical protein